MNKNWKKGGERRKKRKSKADRMGGSKRDKRRKSYNTEDKKG